MSDEIEMRFKDGSAVKTCLERALEEFKGDKPKLIKTIIDSTLRVLTKDTAAEENDVQEFS